MATGGGSRDTRDKEHPEEENLLIPYWKRIKDFTKEIIVNKICHVYNLTLVRDVRSDLFNKLRLGQENLHRKTKVIMMVGQTGAGKSTLINAMINHIMGVEWGDNVRIKLIEEHTRKYQSQTSKVHCYEINHQEGFKIPYSLIFIDTPGFGHTSGIEEDKEVIKQVKACFTSPVGVDHIDAVCFVVKASDIRLTDAQKYVFDSILRIFGKDIEENIIFCVTHCDDPEPDVINSIVKAKVPCAKDEGNRPVYFCFNNSDIPVNSDNKINRGSSKIQKPQWEESMENMEKFFTFLPNLNTKSLTLTQDVLKERRALEVPMEGLTPKIEELMLKAHELEKVKNILKEHEAEIEKNKGFEYEEKETRKKKIPTDKTSVNCLECRSTCHHPCLVSQSRFVYFCEVFYWGGKCCICKHGQSKHFCENHTWNPYVATITKTYEELIKKYEAEYNEKLSGEAICERLTSEAQAAEREALTLTEEATKCLQRLQEIALKPDPLTTADFIDRLINEQAMTRKPGYEERIKSLEKLKQQIMKETRN